MTCGAVCALAGSAGGGVTPGGGERAVAAQACSVAAQTSSALNLMRLREPE